MPSFSIKELRIKGPGKEDAIIGFSDGFNLICGWSQTGKTWILKSIYYLFGSESRPFNSRTGYTAVEGTFETDRYGEVVVTRNLNENVAAVFSDDESISGIYETNFKKQKGVFGYLDNFWLSVIGAEENIKIPKSGRYERRHLSWTNIASIFFIDEHEVAEPKSIILKRNKTETYDAATLLYLLNGEYAKGEERIPSKEERQASKKSLKEYFDEEEEALYDERQECDERLRNLSRDSSNEVAKDVSDEMNLIQQEIDMLVDERKIIESELPSLRKERIDLELKIDRDDKLISEYKADLQRMDFISQGEQAIVSLPENVTCPFCGGTLHEIPESFIEGIRKESKRIVAELGVIVEAQEVSRRQKDAVEERIAVLEEREGEIKERIDERAIDLSDFDSSLAVFSERASLESRIKFIDEKLDDITTRRKNLKKDMSDKAEFKPKIAIENHVGEGFDKLLIEMLDECNFADGVPSWDFTKFDIMIDGMPKSDDQGKGRCSFLNSIVGLMLYRYFNSSEALYRPGFLIIDTPLLGFDENPEGEDRYLREGLYNCLMKYSGDGQVIVVDNIKVLPKIDFPKKGVSVTLFDKDKIEDGTSYGFIPNFKKDIDKEEKE